MLVTQSCPTLCNPRLWPTRLLCPRDSAGKTTGVVAIPFSRGTSCPRIKPGSPALAGRFFTIWATREAVNMKHIILSRCHNFIVKWRIRLKELEPYMSECKQSLIGFPEHGLTKFLEKTKFLSTRGYWYHLLTKLHARDYDIQKAEMSCFRKIQLAKSYHLSSLLH